MAIEDIFCSYDPSRPLDEASTLAAAWYLDPEVAELERRRIFSRCWQPAARLEQVKDAGSEATFTIAGEPGVLVRGADGVLRGFSNVCRHHAAAVMTQPAGKADQ